MSGLVFIICCAGRWKHIRGVAVHPHFAGGGYLPVQKGAVFALVQDVFQAGAHLLIGQTGGFTLQVHVADKKFFQGNALFIRDFL